MVQVSDMGYHEFSGAGRLIDVKMVDTQNTTPSDRTAD